MEQRIETLNNDPCVVACIMFAVWISCIESLVLITTMLCCVYGNVQSGSGSIVFVYCILMNVK